MKRTLLTLLVLTLGLMSGCSSKMESTVGLANPYYDVTSNEVTAVTGLQITLPDSASDARWSGIKGDPVLFDVCFTLDEASYDFRMQSSPTGVNLGITGMYYGWELPQGASFDPFGVYCFTDQTEHVGAILWAKDGYAFSLSTSDHADDNLLQQVMESIGIE